MTIAVDLGRKATKQIFKQALLSRGLLVLIFFYICLFQCVLAAIIIIALRGMFLQVLDLKKLWSVSLIDFVSIKINHYSGIIFGGDS